MRFEEDGVVYEGWFNQAEKAVKVVACWTDIKGHERKLAATEAIEWGGSKEAAFHVACFRLRSQLHKTVQEYDPLDPDDPWVEAMDVEFREQLEADRIERERLRREIEEAKAKDEAEQEAMTSNPLWGLF